MAWSPPARQRRSWLAEQAGGYATPISHHIRDGTRSRVKRDGGRGKKKAIFALARKLFVALWKFVTSGVAVEGAVVRAA
jgi:hypothetical protein